MKHDEIIDTLTADLQPLHFRPPVTHVYNPLKYAAASHSQYLRNYGKPPVEIILVGMNPGPWGMAQTGVPFGEVEAVKHWMGIDADVGTPDNIHPKRPVDGFLCKKSEVSGRRLWGWAKDRFGTPERFFARFFVANYCPLVFMEESGKNRTPDKLPKQEKQPLFNACDNALRSTVRYLRPKYVVGVGAFAAARAKTALKGMGIITGRIIHPSPANPAANKGWAERIEQELTDMGIEII